MNLSAIPQGASPNAGAPYGAPTHAGAPYGAPPNAGAPYGAPPNAGAPYGAPPNAGAPYGAPPNAGAPYGAPPNAGAPYGAPPNAAAPYGAPPNAGAPYGAPPNAGAPYGAPPNAAAPYGAPEASAPPVQLSDVQMAMESEEVAPQSFVPTDLSGLKTYEGYQNVSFQTGGYVPPPPPPSYSDVVGGGSGDHEGGPGDLMEYGRSADITEEEAREALLEFVAQNKCYGKGAAEKMQMNNIAPRNALHYVLETFCEGRTTARTEVPFYGGEIDGPFNGPPPLPWEIPCVPQQGQFQQQMYNIAVPHTAEIRTCGMCFGSRMILCPSCHGYTFVRCRRCFGRGHTGVGDNRRNCMSCHGRGRVRCRHCVMGRITCPHCAGYGQVVNYIQLTVAYMNYKKDYILEQTDMPDSLVRTVEGDQIFQQTQHQVLPLTAFPVREVNENSQRIIEAEKTMHPSERQLNQRQTLRAVPVTQIDYKFKDKEATFFIYGKERRVHSPDYPQQCCWGCNIL